MDIVCHLIGDHSQYLPHNYTDECWKIGIDHPEVAAVLQEILDKRITDFDQTIYGGTTNYNESFHKKQLIYDNKSIYFPVSQEIRDKLAVFHRNEGPIFEIELRRRMNLFELSQRNETKVKKMDVQRTQQSVKRSTPEYKTQDRIDRKIISDKRKKEKPGDYKRDTDYSGSE